MNKIRLGIIGVGNMGSGHARNVLSGKCPDIELSAVADNNPSRLEWAKENLSTELNCFSTAEEMLDSGLIDACLVAVPHYDHAKYAMECMKRGIHVMVEKPAGVYTLQVKEMNAEADRHPEVVFGMMFNQRTNCLYRKCANWFNPANMARFDVPIGSLQTGIVLRPIMTAETGVQPGRERAEACCSTSARISWIFGNGFAECLGKCIRACTLVFGTILRWRTT